MIGVLLLSTVLRIVGQRLWRTKIHPDSGRNFPEQWPAGLVRFFYFVGLPYVVVISGMLSSRLLGLGGLEYFIFVTWAPDLWLIQLQQALMLMLLSWLLDSRSLVPLGLAALLSLTFLKSGLVRQQIDCCIARSSSLDTVYEGVHWAFYRAIFWSITDNLYLGVVLGTVYIAFEGVVGHKMWQQQPSQQQSFLMNMIILILIALLFFYVPNLWLLLPIHVAMIAVVRTPFTAVD